MSWDKKMTVLEHPQLEDLARYIYSANQEHDQDIGVHVAECSSCFHKVEEIKNVLAKFKQGMEFSYDDVISFNHPSDQQLNYYVYEILDQTERDLIEHHISECYSCLKASMRLRTHLTQRTLEGNTVEQKDVESPMDNVALLGHDKKPNLNSANHSNIPYFAAAGLLLFMIGFFFPSFQTEPPTLISQAPNQTHENSDAINTLDQRRETLQVSLNADSDERQTEGLQKVNNGVLNWYGGYVETKAVGTADMKKMVNPVQAEMVAEKTARHIAYAQLAEILGGVQVTQKSAYKELLVNLDNLSIENERFIKGAKVMSKSIEWIKDTPKATVIMRLPLYGETSLRSIINKNNPNKIEKPNLNDSTSLQQASIDSQYSGILLDARNTNYKPSLFIDVASNKNTITQYATEHYANADKQHVGNTPYIIKAKIASESGSVMLSQKDAEIMTSLLKKQPMKKQQNLAVLF